MPWMTCSMGQCLAVSCMGKGNLGETRAQWQLLSSPVTVPPCRCKSCRTLTSASCSTRNCASKSGDCSPISCGVCRWQPLSWADRGLRQLQNFPCCASALKCGPNEYVYVLNCPPCRCDAAGQKVIIWYFRKRMNLALLGTTRFVLTAQILKICCDEHGFLNECNMLPNTFCLTPKSASLKGIGL